MSALSAWMFCGGVAQGLALGASRRSPRRTRSTSALRRLAAISKAMRVRVLGSRKRLTIVLPRRAGTFFTLRWRIFLNAAAVAWICSISAQAQFLDRDEMAAGPGHGREAARGRVAIAGGSRSGSRAGVVAQRRPGPPRPRAALERRAREVGGHGEPAAARGRRARRARPRPGLPWSNSSSSAAFTVRPVKSTSSTSTTVAPLHVAREERGRELLRDRVPGRGRRGGRRCRGPRPALFPGGLPGAWRAGFRRSLFLGGGDPWCARGAPRWRPRAVLWRREPPGSRWSWAESPSQVLHAGRASVKRNRI